MRILGAVPAGSTALQLDRRARHELLGLLNDPHALLSSGAAFSSMTVILA
jgi:hypothetical protein